MNNTSLIYLAGLAFFISTFAYDNAELENNWQEMQQKYLFLNENLLKSAAAQREQVYCHQHWKKCKEEFKGIVLGPLNRNFVQTGIVKGTMTRSGYTSHQAYETCFLQKCITNQTLHLLNKFHEPDFFNTPKECKQFNCTTNTLGHLFYAAKLLEQARGNRLHTIVEFGGGYGNLAYILKTIIPESRYIIIDLPELIALQYFFLKSNLPDTSIIIHDQIPSDYEDCAIHLIPSVLLDEMNIECDAFISTFAITEAPEAIQKIISGKKFFNATFSYICGQLDGWGKDAFVHHSYLQREFKDCFKYVACHPFHIELHSYEMTGNNL